MRKPVISVLVPSRGRPKQWARMVRSAMRTATHIGRVEFVTYLDEDDPKRLDYIKHFFDREPEGGTTPFLLGPRILLSEAWNKCYEAARGEILMHAGDDITFNTTGWDERVREEFAKIPDRIGLVYGDDLSTNFPELATHGFLHRRWVQTVGYFLPPLFSSDWNDVWISEVATNLGRMFPLPDVVIEHHHYTFGKAERDLTHHEREERGARDKVVDVFKQTANERERDAAKLRAVMA